LFQGDALFNGTSGTLIKNDVKETQYY